MSGGCDNDNRPWCPKCHTWHRDDDHEQLCDKCQRIHGSLPDYCTECSRVERVHHARMRRNRVSAQGEVAN